MRQQLQPAAAASPGNGSQAEGSTAADSGTNTRTSLLVGGSDSNSFQHNNPCCAEAGSTAHFSRRSSDLLQISNLLLFAACTRIALNRLLSVSKHTHE